MLLSIIAAVADDLAIGQDNQLLCHIPGDLKRFKTITTGHPIIMGRKTFESLPVTPLLLRRNIILTHTPNSLPSGCEGVETPQQAMELIQSEEETFVIGGAQIYSIFLPFVQTMYLTEIHSTFPKADAFFPSFNPSEWIETFREDHDSSDSHPSFSFVNLIRK
jgi:dihydrofolate reductase